MTVNCLNQLQKDNIVGLYKANDMSQKELAIAYNRSERTLHRVLVEAGVATPVARLQGEAHQVMQLLKKNYINLDQLKLVLKRSLGDCYVE